ncbi:MAG: YigZ family protein [Tissierellia bacterium]|nr:YigZ family protein [Tissierellia bacterium]
MEEYKTILASSEANLEIKKSMFIARAKAVENEDQAVDFIDQVRRENRQANHNCYAYIIGANKGIQRYSDDNEPQGTAGLPILGVLKSEDLTNICLVVTRYFGGVKLGASGLIRAYSKASSLALEEADLVFMKKYLKINLSIDYTLLGKVENYILTNRYFEISRDYTDKVTIYLYISEKEFEKFEKDIVELSSGKLRIEIDKKLLLAEKNRKIIGG